MTLIHEDISSSIMIQFNLLHFVHEIKGNILFPLPQSWRKHYLALFLSKLNIVITKITQPQASWGQDVQANRADERWGWTISAGIQCHRGWGRHHSIALETQEEFSGFVHVDCIPLHTLDYHRLGEIEREGRGDEKPVKTGTSGMDMEINRKLGGRREKQEEEQGRDRVGNVGTIDREWKGGWGRRQT